MNTTNGNTLHDLLGGEDGIKAHRNAVDDCILESLETNRRQKMKVIDFWMRLAFARKETIDRLCCEKRQLERSISRVEQEWTRTEEDFAWEEDQFRTAWRAFDKRYNSYKQNSLSHRRQKDGCRNDSNRV
ncbi:hypothetical protein LCGC14_1780290 [marine sediment metagenome]|uniref:Uncharacterized protein n=1 Tax=marine sediment metagenome TaxID=412755 RepID=A0A0F9HI99_9ZZZZ